MDKVFENKRYGTNRNNSTLFDETFLETALAEPTRSLKWSNLIINGTFASRDEFAYLTGLTLSREKYTAIKNCYLRVKKNSNAEGKEPQPLSEFFLTLK